MFWRRGEGVKAGMIWVIKQRQNMKIGVPALNVVISVLYVVLAGVGAYWLKLSHRRRRELQEGNTALHVPSYRKEISFGKVFAVSWLKKYTLAGAILNEHRKYLITELFIISIYAVTCLRINRIIIWPVAFIAFLLPLLFVCMEIAVAQVEGLLREDKKKANQTINNMHENEIQIEAVNIETIKPITVLSSHGSNAEVEVYRERSIVEIGFVSGLTFVTFVLFYQTVFTLTNSISNSGQLNISSLALIVLIDQLAVRCGAGLLTFAILKILERNNLIIFAENKLVHWLCHEQLTKLMIDLQRQRLRRQLQQTASPLKHNSHELFRQELEAKNEGTSSQNNQHFNLMNLQPETIPCNEPEAEDPLEREVYLTTPEKQLFQGNQAQDSPKERSILHSLIDNKENETINNDLNKSTLKSHEQSKHLEETSKEDDPADVQNFRTDFHLQNSRVQSRGGRKGKKRAGRRVLKLTGNSPYLQYLPNMLKNIDKVKNAQKDKKML